MKNYLCNYRIFFLVLYFILVSFNGIFAQAKPVSTEAVSVLALKRGLKEVDLGIYGGTLFMQGMSELAVLQKNPKNLLRTIEIFEKFKI